MPRDRARLCRGVQLLERVQDAPWRVCLLPAYEDVEEQYTRCGYRDRDPERRNQAVLCILEEGD